MNKTMVINVEGMHCSGCENRINNAVKTIKGVKSVKANHMDKNVVVIANDKVDEYQIKDMLVDLGFTIFV